MPVVVGSALALLLLILPAAAAAQDAPAPRENAPADPQDNGQIRKEPPPLFPRHGRGIYRNAKGEAVIDATPQSPPLVIDDPGVPDDGQFEINLMTHVDYARAVQRVELLTLDANYGLRPVVAGYHLPAQIALLVPLAGTRSPAQPFVVGPGTAEAGLKLNLYDDEHRGISVSFYPQLEFPTPGAHGVARGLSEPGQILMLPLLVAREFHDLTFVFNGGFEKPFGAPDRAAAVDLGAGFGRAITRKDAAMVEIRAESSLNLRHDRLVFVNAGFIHGVRHVVAYASVGRAVLADDGLAHTYGGVGIKLQLDTKTRTRDRRPRRR